VEYKTSNYFDQQLTVNDKFKNQLFQSASNSLFLTPMDKRHIKLVATDLDGTFLKDDRSISERNLEALHQLGKQGIVRVVATGRNLRKVDEALSPDVPFDYIVFSSGAGVFDWKKRKHIFDQNITPESTGRLVTHFKKQDYNFYAFAPAPENHRLWYHRGKEECEEFNNYLSFHNSFSEPLAGDENLDNGLCQFLLIIPEDEQNFAELKEEIELQCNEIRVIRSSSPVTEGYIWVEVFHHEVSKGMGVHKICKLLEIKPEETAGIGNDYNDLDLLGFTGYSFLTGNAPEPLKRFFTLAPTNEEDAFAHTVQPLLQ
jgi:Cof subfamily protein (haloacid dehalogenase superfamily)